MDAPRNQTGRAGQWQCAWLVLISRTRAMARCLPAWEGLRVAAIWRAGLLVLMCWLGGPARAQAEPFPIDALAQPLSVAAQLQVLDDASRQWQYEQVTALPDSAWHANDGPLLFRSATGPRYWFRLVLDVNSAVAATQPALVIPLFTSQIYQLDLWLQDAAGSLQHWQTGYLRPYDPALTRNGYYSFPLPVVSGPVRVTGMLDYSAAGLPVSIPLSVASAEQLDQMKERKQGVLIAFYAVMLVILVYNSFLWWSIRQRLYGRYVLFLLAGTGVAAVLDGSFQRLVFVNSAATDFLAGQMLVVVLGLAYLAFVKTALEDFRFARWARWGYRLLMGVGSVLLLVFVVAGTQPYVGPLSNLYLSIGMVYLLAVIAQALWQRIPLAGYFLLSECMPILGGSVFLLQVYGVVQANEWLQWSSHLGFVIESVLLSLVLAAQTKMAQQRALLHLKQYEQLYEDSSEGRLRFNRQSRQVSCNRALALMLGFESVEDPALAEGFLRMYDSRRFDAVREHLCSGVPATGLPATGVPATAIPFRLRHRKTGQDVWVVAAIRVASSAPGQFDQVEITLIDETERHLRQQAQLEKEQVQLQNQAKSQFFASMSHEFRTPLTAVMGYAELALEPGVTPRERLDYLSTIRDSAGYLLHLINDTLDVSKIEAQKMSFQAQAFELPTLCQELYDYAWILAARKQIGFRIEFECPLPRIIISDRTRIKQVLVNLCSNGIKFTEQGEVVVTVQGDAARSRLVFAVRDSGIGIRAEEMERLFDAFAQSDDPGASERMGTGLGLHLSRLIATGLGGEIQVQSTPGAGSTFTFSLTLAGVGEEGWVQAFPSLSTALFTEVEPVPDPGGLGHLPRVLIADDNAVNLQLLAVLLGRMGARASLAADGLEAIAALIRDKPDLVFMDIDMPVMDGMTAIRHIRSLQIQTPIYALTGTVTDEMVEACRREGFAGHLAKPYDRHAIEAVLRVHTPN